MVQEAQRGLKVLVVPVNQAVQYFQCLRQFQLHLVGLVVLELPMDPSDPMDQLALQVPVFQDFLENQRHLVVLDFLEHLAAHLLPEHLSLQHFQLDLTLLEVLVLLDHLDFPEDQDFLDFREFQPLQLLLQSLAVRDFQLLREFHWVQSVQPVLECLETHCCLQHHLVQVHPVDQQGLESRHYLEVRCHPWLQQNPGILVYLDFQVFR